MKNKINIINNDIIYSFLVHIDENGDAAGNYTILGRKLMNNNKTNETTYGLFPIGTFITTPVENKNNIPVSGTLTYKEITLHFMFLKNL